jgi:predicted nucleotide-binding protein
MTPEVLIQELKRYEGRLLAIEQRFTRTPSDISIAREDDDPFRQLAMTLYDFLRDTLPGQRYAQEVGQAYADGVSNYVGSPSLHSVQEIRRVVGVAIARVERNPDIVGSRGSAMSRSQRHPKKVFIIHGHDEAKRRELKSLLSERLGLIPIVLSEQPDEGCSTIIEKFEHYAPSCSYAVALFTPDDQVGANDQAYVQARPNVIYELGWFCGVLGRKKVMMLLKEGTTVFSDFSGIIQKRFRIDISEKFMEIESDLRATGMLAKP